MDESRGATSSVAIDWRRVLLGGLTISVAAAALVGTVTSAAALSHTFDEPHHLATGLEWWQRGTYRSWTENPPLPKVVTALAPYLAGLRLPATVAADGLRLTPTSSWDVGLALLYGDGGYQRTLMLARLGTLVFLLLTLALTFALAGGRRRLASACVATVLVASYPPLLGHAGLATTDVATVATVLLFLWALDRWADQPSRARAGALGVAFALAVLCKLTAPPVCAVAGLSWLAGRRGPANPAAAPGDPWRGRERSRQAALAGLVASVVVWAGYRFSTGRLDDLPAAGYLGRPLLPPPAQRSALLAWLCQLPLPAPELWHGLLFLKSHNDSGHAAYLLGQVHDRGGFWDFYLFGLLLKSPLPLLVLLAAALIVLAWSRGRLGPGARGRAAGLSALAILALSTTSTVNIGMRHVLVVVPLLAIFGARAAASWFGALASRGRTVLVAALGLLLVGQVAVAATARPELMAYFNPLAGRQPGRALIDSDLDWGQDFLILRRELRARGIATAHVGFFGTFDPCASDAPTLVPLRARQPVTGWVVLSEQFYRSRTFFSFRRDTCTQPSRFHFDLAVGDAYDWLAPYQPVARLGASLRLYHIPDSPPPSP